MIWMLSMVCIVGSVSCQPRVSPITVESPVTAKGCTRAFLEEHESLFAENIRLKAALKQCHAKP